MAESEPLEQAVQEAIRRVNPTGDPNAVIADLMAVGETWHLGDQMAELLERFIAHHDIDAAAPALVAVLRSGYQVLADDDPLAMTEHLRIAVIGEGLSSSQGAADWNDVWAEVCAEVEHVSHSTREDAARMLLAQLLLEAVGRQWDELVDEAFPDAVGQRAAVDVTGFIAATKKQNVLLLGPDGSEVAVARLRRIAASVDAQGYRSRLVRDIPEHPDLALIPKVLINALTARFVVVENSESSGHLYELPFVRMAECVVAILQEAGKGATWMVEDMLDKHPLMRRFIYEPDHLEVAVREACSWAEDRIAANVKIHREAWPWVSSKDLAPRGQAGALPSGEGHTKQLEGNDL